MQARAAELVRVSGTVEVQHAAPSGSPQGGQAWTLVRSGQELQRGDSLRTYSASVAQLTFAGAVQWQLAAESQLNLAEALAGGS